MELDEGRGWMLQQMSAGEVMDGMTNSVGTASRTEIELEDLGAREADCDVQMALSRCCSLTIGSRKRCTGGPRGC